VVLKFGSRYGMVLWTRDNIKFILAETKWRRKYVSSISDQRQALSDLCDQSKGELSEKMAAHRPTVNDNESWVMRLISRQVSWTVWGVETQD